MSGIVTSLLGTLRLPGGPAKLDTCAVCGDAVREADEYMRLPGGGYVHRGCSTYRMRQREQNRRRGRVPALRSR